MPQALAMQVLFIRPVLIKSDQGTGKSWLVSVVSCVFPARATLGGSMNSWTWHLVSQWTGYLIYLCKTGQVCTITPQTDKFTERVWKAWRMLSHAISFFLLMHIQSIQFAFYKWISYGGISMCVFQCEWVLMVCVWEAFLNFLFNSISFRLH